MPQSEHDYLNNQTETLNITVGDDICQPHPSALLFTQPHSPGCTPARPGPRRIKHREETPLLLCVPVSRKGFQCLTWRTQALVEGLEKDSSQPPWLLTHNSTREKCRSLTHLLWRVLKTTRKAIHSSSHKKHVCT